MKNLTVNNQPISIIRSGAKMLMPISDIAKIYNREHRKNKRTIENYVSFCDYFHYGQFVRISTKHTFIFLMLSLHYILFKGYKDDKFNNRFTNN